MQVTLMVLCAKERMTMTQTVGQLLVAKDLRLEEKTIWKIILRWVDHLTISSMESKGHDLGWFFNYKKIIWMIIYSLYYLRSFLIVTFWHFTQTKTINKCYDFWYNCFYFYYNGLINLIFHFICFSLRNKYLRVILVKQHLMLHWTLKVTVK